MKYLVPHSLAEASELLLDTGNSMLLAGGTDLLVEKRAGRISPEAVIDIKRIDNLDRITLQENRLVIGALATITDLLRYKSLPEELEALHDAGKEFGCYEIRNRATIAGNLAHASPGAEFGSTLIALNAEAEIFSIRGIRNLPVENLYIKAGKTVLERGEIIAKIIIPLRNNSASSYFRASRVNGMDMAVINCALQGFYDNNKTGGLNYRVCLGAAASVPVRLPEVEKMLSRIDGTAARSSEVFSGIKSYLLKTLNPRALSLRAAPFTKKVLAGNLIEDACCKVRERLIK
ncbi:MAG: hypothetical protein GXP33_11830 [Spirochaetes bacterium]|nr:hypothetical protein [Spirochaetota bacterium]